MELAEGLCRYCLNCDDRSPGSRQGMACFAHFLREHPECSENIRECSGTFERTFENVPEHSRIAMSGVDRRGMVDTTAPPPTYSNSTSSRGPWGLMTPCMGMRALASKTPSHTGSKT